VIQKIGNIIMKQAMSVLGGILVGGMLVNLYIGVATDEMTRLIAIQSFLMIITSLWIISSRGSEKYKKNET